MGTENYSTDSGNSPVFPFREQGNFTMVHHLVLDQIMPEAPPNAFKILMLVLRKTVGWHKDQDSISYSQIMEGTGIKSDKTVTTSLKWLVAEGMLLRTETAVWEPTAYALNRGFAIIPTVKITVPTPEITVEPTVKITDTKDSVKDKLPKGRSDDPQKALPKQLLEATAERLAETGHSFPTQNSKWGHISSWRGLIERGVPEAELWKAVARIVARKAERGVLLTPKAAYEDQNGKPKEATKRRKL